MGAVTLAITVILCYITAGVVHELGHIMVGMMYGWKFHLLVIGPLGITADESGRVKFYLEKRAALWGGVGGAFPKEASEENIKVWSKVLMGGPLASILMGVIFLPLGIASNNRVLLLLGAMPLGMGIVCALPYPLKSGILYTDGGRWSRLRKGGQETAEEVALFMLTETQMTGGSFASVDTADIEALVRSKDPAINYFGHYFRLQHFKAIGNTEMMETSAREMEKLKDKVPGVIVSEYKAG